MPAGFSPYEFRFPADSTGDESGDGPGIAVDVSADVEHPLDAHKLAGVLRRILRDHGVNTGAVAVAIIGDATMHELNVRHLDHDYTTDVLSFDYTDAADADAGIIDGELIVNAEMAAREGPEHGLTPAEELLLYCIHGTLHLCGYDDHTTEGRDEMWRVQQEYLDRAKPLD